MRIESELTAEALQRELVGLLKNPKRLAEMSARAKAMGKPGAVERIGKMVLQARR
jgi:UDP-N-acetylglucosamine:LPS N-acetylglucosamine transferase